MSPDAGRPEGRTSGRSNDVAGGSSVGSDRIALAFEVDGRFATPAEVGAVLHISGDAEVVAAELIEKVGPSHARDVGAWCLLLAEEVGR